MKALTPADQIFLWLEKRQQPMHVGGLQLFSYPEGAQRNYLSQLAQQMRAQTQAQPPFNQHLITRLRGLFWTQDNQFDIDHHFRFAHLPKPGRIRELLTYVSQQHSSLLDRARPLWEVHLIDGVAGKRFAIYMKVHHALMDGVAATRMIQRALSEDADERDMLPPWAQHNARRVSRTDARDAVTGLGATLRSAGSQLGTLPTVARALYRSTREVRKNPDYVSSFQAPRSILNQRITGSRRFAAQSYSLDRIRSTGKALGATVNDTVLAMCASALRHYLLDMDALPEKPLIAMVPMSLRKDDSASGNQVAMILANLGTHEADASARLEIIQRSVKNAKQRFANMTSAEIMNYTALVYAPSGLNLVTGIAPRWQSYNVVISNVPGPKQPLYWNGARLEGMYPVSIVLDGLALNITLTSYAGKLEFGVIACRRTMPKVQRLLDYFEQGLTELEALAA